MRSISFFFLVPLVTVLISPFNGGSKSSNNFDMIAQTLSYEMVQFSSAVLLVLYQFSGGYWTPGHTQEIKKYHTTISQALLFTFSCSLQLHHPPQVVVVDPTTPPCIHSSSSTTQPLNHSTATSTQHSSVQLSASLLFSISPSYSPSSSSSHHSPSMPLPFSPKYFIPVVYAALCWLLVLVDLFIPSKDKLSNHGITSLKKHGLMGIFFAPFLNATVVSMLGITLGILLFGCLLLRRAILDIVLVTITCIPLAGFAFWLVGQGYATGSGALVAAWFGYLCAIPFFERPVKFVDFAIAVISAILYVVILYFMPGGTNLQGWIYNLCGLLSGVLISVLKHKVFKKVFQHWDHITSPSDGEPNDTTRLLDPVANKPTTTTKPANPPPNSNPFE